VCVHAAHQLPQVLHGRLRPLQALQMITRQCTMIIEEH
jgi:hypothetical protein